MSLIDTILGRQSKSAPAKAGHASYVQLEDGDAGYNVMATVASIMPAAGVWNRIWEKTVPAQTEFAWGFGIPHFPDNQGYMWFMSSDSGTGYDSGLVRLGLENYSRHKYVPYCEVSDTQLHQPGSTYGTVGDAALIDKKQMFAMPERGDLPHVGQDSRLTIDYRTIVKATTTDTVGWSIPITVYN